MGSKSIDCGKDDLIELKDDCCIVVLGLLIGAISWRSDPVKTESDGLPNLPKDDCLEPRDC